MSAFLQAICMSAKMMERGRHKADDISHPYIHEMFDFLEFDKRALNSKIYLKE